MPRVSDDHLEARRAQIIQAAVRCFARHGFHGTSMQDVFAESGLSAGAVYRYFPSKSALVHATSEFVFGQLNEALTEQAQNPDVTSPADLVHAVASRVDTVVIAANVPITRLAMNAWSEALRDPDVAELVRTIIGQVRGRLASIARGWQAAGHLDADVDPAEFASAMYSLLIGYLVQTQLAGDLDPDRYRAGVAGLSAVGAEVPRGHA